MLRGEEVRSRRRPWGIIASFALHVVVLAVLLYRPEPLFVTLQSVQLGDGLKSYHVLYVPPNSEASDEQPAAHNKLALKSVLRRPHAKPAAVKAKEMPAPNPEGEVADRNAHAGTVYGSMWALMEEGHDVKPAFPVVYPSPDLSQVELPLGYQGDIVIEVTIERDGTVSHMRVIQSIGHDVDEKFLAAVQKWRFRPAILDGTPIASKHDVHFHLPS
jgi:TonB family protein